MNASVGLGMASDVHAVRGSPGVGRETTKRNKDVYMVKRKREKNVVMADR